MVKSIVCCFRLGVSNLDDSSSGGGKLTETPSCSNPEKEVTTNLANQINWKLGQHQRINYKKYIILL